MLFCLCETCDDSDLLGIFVDLIVRIEAVEIGMAGLRLSESESQN